MSDNLRFADYAIRLGSVPSKFEIPSDVLILSNSVIPTHNFKLEKEVVAKADKMNAAADSIKRKAEEERQAQEAKARQEEQARLQREQALKPAPAPVPVPVPVQVAAKPAVDESPLLDLDFGDEETPAPAVAAGSAAVAMAVVSPPATPDNDTLVTQMMAQTKQERDVCYFYLECADWNLVSAIELLKSMQAISN